MSKTERTCKAGCPAPVRQLIERFDRHRDTYKQQSYNETQVRREFIDPLFKALGWDVDNEQGYAEAYKDVIHEDAIKVGGATKAPDYCFRIGGTRKFFLEAKKPAVSLKEHAESAYQLRRYAWSARLPLSVLTDFEELAVYDCRIRPHKSDKSSVGRTMYFTFDQYVDRWDEIASVFSREAVLQGSFDKYAESARRKKGTAEVDVEFLREIERWREQLAANFALRNRGLAVRELNFAVQRTIDRIIFLRLCEDRGIEPYGQLQGLCAARSEPRPSDPSRDREGADRVSDAAKLYHRLAVLFRRADDRYNSSLFYFTPEKGREPPDELTLSLQLDDKPLRDILHSLYYPECPYEFSVLPPEILGQVYEQFLGKVIRLTKGHRAKVEEKPEVRKAGGVYYTPTYIVDYIVKHTVGKLLEGKTPKQVGPDPKPSPKRKRGVMPSPKRKRGDKLRILDPACGSGSFLLGAYQYLLDWHRDWYVSDGPAPKQNRALEPSRDRQGAEEQTRARKQNRDREGAAKHTDRIYEGAGGQWHLTVQEKKRILLNNIYGVDIDPQAVEVTKLSLLLKVLEGETSETIGQTLRLFHERALPDLSDNIKCGNSLIGPDFYENQQMDLFDDEDRYRINAFDWEAEFPEVFDPSPKRKRGVITPPGDKPVAHAPGSDPIPDPRSGFDAVIGNPPYVRIQNLKEFAPLEAEHYKRHYVSGSKGNFDIYVVFVERGLDLLSKTGRLGMILPHKFFNAKYGQALRHIIASGKHLSHVVHFADQQVFAGAATYTCLMFLDKPVRDECRVVKVTDLAAWRTGTHAHEGCISADRITAAEWSFNVGKGAELFEKLSAMPTNLGDVAARMYQGPITSADSVYLFKEFNAAGNDRTAKVYSKELGEFVELEQRILRAVVRSGSVGRYHATPTALVLFPYDVENGTASLIPADKLERRFPLAWKYLTRNRKLLEKRERGKFRDAAWYRFGRTQNLGMWQRRKLMIPYMVTCLAAYLDDEDDYYFINVTTGGYGITADESRGTLPYLCGLLNSRLLDFFFRKVSTTFHGGYFAANKQYVERLPIRTINFRAAADKTRHDDMVTLVQRMLDLHKQLAAAKTPTDKTAIQRQIDATDKRIDQLVYELYGLTDEEVAIVEDATRKD